MVIFFVHFDVCQFIAMVRPETFQGKLEGKAFPIVGSVEIPKNSIKHHFYFYGYIKVLQSRKQGLQTVVLTSPSRLYV